MFEKIKTELSNRQPVNKRVVINTRYGGFQLSQKGLELFKELSGERDLRNKYDDFMCERENPHLIEVINRLGRDAYDDRSFVRVEEFTLAPGQSYYIHEYDGNEEIRFRW